MMKRLTFYQGAMLELTLVIVVLMVVGLMV
jgi:hypothetical protein